MYTRKQYLNQECTHDQYYSDFVSDTTKRIVLSRYSKKQLTEAMEADEHLNSIPLHNWDGMGQDLRYAGIKSIMEQKGDSITLAGLVCILKQSAKHIINS